MSEHPLRASHADRQRAVDLLEAALAEGRLDSAEHDDRVSAAQSAKMPGDLAALLADLPDRPGVWEWDSHLRTRATDRRRAAAWLGDALVEGALSVEEHKQRLEKVATAGTYDLLKKYLDGVPGPPDAIRERLFVTKADRERLIARLDRAMADGWIQVDDRAQIEAAVASAERYGALDRAAAMLDEHAGSDLRAEVVRRLDHAYDEGRIQAAEHEKRVQAAQEATSNTDLTELLNGLTESAKGATPEWIVGRAKSVLAKHRLSDAERKHAARALEHALNDGRLDLGEYDKRVRRAYSAKKALELRPLLDDLVHPEAVPKQAVPKQGAGKPKRRRLPIVAAAVVVMVIAGTLAVVAWSSSGSDVAAQLKISWTAARDRPAEIRAEGNWVDGSSLIRARPDQVTAYEVADGRGKWTFPVPGRNRLCTMSRETGPGIGLIGFGSAEGNGACSMIAALDLGTGQLLWQRSREVPDTFDGTLNVVDDEVGIASGTAVIKERAGFLAVGLRANEEKWRLPVPAGCRAYSVTAAGDDAALMSVCEDKTVDLSMVDPSSGRIRFRTGLRVHEDDLRVSRVRNEKTTVVLSTTPLVVRTTDDGSRTHDAIVSFDSQGSRRATISLSQHDLDIAPKQLVGPHVWPTWFSARRSRVLAVVGDTLIAPVRRAGGTNEDQVIAFSLADGHRLWQADLSSDIVAGANADGRFVVATSDEKIHTLSVADGRAPAAIPVEGLSKVAPQGWEERFELRLVGDRYAISNEDGTAGPPPAFMFE